MESDQRGLSKIKQFDDDEFPVIAIRPSAEGYAILTCALPNGETVDATAPGTMEEKHKTMKQKNKYLGRTVQLKYAGVTKDGIPFHPVATMWRNKKDE